MAELEGISAEEVRRKVKSGKVLPVCAYDEEERFRSVHVGGAISFQEFEDRLPSLSKDQEIVFYCPCPKRAFLPARGADFLRKGTGIGKLWREAWRPGKRPDPLS